MKVITKDSILEWKDLEEILNLDLNIIEDYMTDGFVSVKYELTPLAYILLHNYCKKGAFKLINAGIEFELLEYNLANGYEELSLVCKDMTGKVFEFKYNDSMVITLSTANTDLKMSILKFKAVQEMSDEGNAPLAKLLSIHE